MKKTILILSAFVLALGLTQCKKEEVPATTNDNIDNGVRITLNVGNSSRANVDPNGNPNWATVSFETGDYIYVGYNNAYVGYLECTSATAETGYGYFEGTVNIETVVSGEKLHFYMLGGKDFQPDPTSISSNQLSVNISDQSSKYPVISCATSNEDYVATTTAYTSDRLMNKVSIMKFNVTTPSTAAICITGMNNKVTVDFTAPNGTDNGFAYDKEGVGLIEMPAKGANNETWAIVLPQEALTEGNEGTAFTYDGYKGNRPALGAIASNQYITTVADDLDVSTFDINYMPLTFEAKTAGATVKLRKGISGPSVTLEYSTNGITWTSYSVTSTGVPITLDNIGDKVMFRGTNKTFAKEPTNNKYNFFSLGGDCYVYGNVMSLIDSTDFATTTAFADGSSYNFCYLFRNCSKLYNHPTKSIVLPATTLVTACYCRMFNGCTNLTAAPDLPASTLADDCYGYMFYNCTNLVAAPDLQATTLANSCYLHMFEGCTGLTTVPATLPVTTLAYGCYQGMFKNCTSLTTAPELPAPTLAENCYQDMFWGCSALTSVTCLATDINASGCVYLWLKDVTTTGTLHVAEGTTSNWTASGSVPSTWAISEQ